MPAQIGWSVEAKLLYEIKQLTRALSSRTYIQVFPTFASFPIPGITGTLYVDEATGDIYVWNGTSYVLLSSGITALNGLIAAAQLLTTGSSGTDFNISSVGTTHTFNIPTASAANRGLVSSADWSTFNSKIGGTGVSGQVSYFNGTSSITGSNNLFWDNTNVRLGIATAAPTQRLTILDGNLGFMNTAAGGIEVFRIGVGTSTSQIAINVGGTTGLAYSTVSDTTKGALYVRNSHTNSFPAYSFLTDTNTGISNANGTADTLSFITGGTEFMRITSTGDVGIGTSSPAYLFHVSNATADANTFVGQTSARGLFTQWRYNATAANAYGEISTFGGDNRLEIQSQLGGGNTIINRSSGNVLIGTGTEVAGYKFQVAGSIYNTTGAVFAASSGNVGIGFTNPLVKLAVNGTSQFTQAPGNTAGTLQIEHVGVNAWKFGVTTDNTSSLVIGNDIGGTFANKILYIANAGNIGIFTSTPSERLHVNGGMRVENGAVLAATSGQVAVGASTFIGTEKLNITFNSSTAITQAINTKDANASANNTYHIVIRKSDDTYLGGIGRSSTNNAMFVDGNSYLDLRTGGTERMRITSDGNVGIGTASPFFSRLHVTQTGAGLQDVVIFENAQTAAANVGSALNFCGIGTVTQSLIRGAWNGAATTDAYMSFGTRGSNTVQERMRITSGGNVLIGTTTDLGYKLNVQGGDVTLGSNRTLDWGSGNMRIVNNNFDMIFQNFNGTTIAESARITGAGNVGIGTTSPAQKLEVVGAIRANGGTIFAQGSGTEASGWQLNAITQGYDLTNGYGWITAGGASTRANLILQFGGGNVGIGTASPSAKLSVSGTTLLSGNLTINGETDITWSDRYLRMNFDNDYRLGMLLTSSTRRLTLFATGPSGDGGSIAFNTRAASASGATDYGTERMRITSGGNVLVGTTTDATYKLDVSGSLRSTADAYFATSSGSVGIKTTTPSAALDVAGLIRTTSTNLPTSGQGLEIGYAAGQAEILPFNRDTISYTSLRIRAAEIRIFGNSGAGGIFVSNDQNIGFSQLTFGTSAQKVLAVGNGTAPTTSPADAFQMYSADVVAGNAAPHIMTENGAVLKMYQETTGVGNAAFVQGSVNAVYEDSTFDGYTLKQIVKALRNQGLLA